MTQTERRYYQLHELLREQNLKERVEIPANKDEQAQLLRGLFNVRMPKMATPNFLAIQDAYLQEEIQRKGIIRLTDLTPVQDGIYLWLGDITTLACDAIVNATNAQMLGCFCPNHGCIDNAIHTFAGVQLRASCAKIMEQQGRPEPTGRAKITPAYNLPCKYVLHTVGPIIHGALTEKDRKQLASCYRSCLKLAEQNDIKSIAFCCISIGEFHFPEDIAAQIAVNTVTEYREQSQQGRYRVFKVQKMLFQAQHKELVHSIDAKNQSCQRRFLVPTGKVLVRRLLQKISVYDDHFTIEFKSGVSVDINGSNT